MTTTTDLTVANTIAAQIGFRAFQMMGTKYKVCDTLSLAFDIHGSAVANKVKVILELDDTYTVQFWKCRSYTAKMVLEIEGIYADSLNQCIEYRTGLALSL
jgi:hypothetical protein